MKLMIVDDSLVIRRKIERACDLTDVTEIVTAVDGLDALEKARQHMPDIVTMDITMPNMDGVECVKRLVELKPDIYILVVSALKDKATSISAIQNGAHGFLPKPFTDKRLPDAVNELIQDILNARQKVS